MDRKEIPLQKETVRADSPTPALGPVELDLPAGRAFCVDAVSCTLINIAHNNGCKYAVIISAGQSDEGKLFGTLAAFTPDEARSFAASLLHTADLCDGGQKGLN